MIAYSRVFVNDLIKKANADEIERFVAGAVIVKDDSALILQRARADFMGGLYEIPSGGVEEGESIEDALARETLEETGLKISGILYYVSSFDYLSSKGKKTRQFNFLVKVDDGGVKLSEEHEKFAFVKQDDLDAYNITPDVKEAIESALNRR